MMKALVVGEGRVINEKAQRAVRGLEGSEGRESRLAMIQMLIPLGIREVERELQTEVTELVGIRYSRAGECTRWGRSEARRGDGGGVMVMRRIPTEKKLAPLKFRP